MPVILEKGRVGIDAAMHALAQQEGRVADIEIAMKGGSGRTLDAMIRP